MIWIFSSFSSIFLKKLNHAERKIDPSFVSPLFPPFVLFFLLVEVGKGKNAAWREGEAPGVEKERFFVLRMIFFSSSKAHHYLISWDLNVKQIFWDWHLDVQ